MATTFSSYKKSGYKPWENKKETKPVEPYVEKPFTPSEFQAAIFDFVRDNPRRDLFIEAVAGSGKTTTLFHLVKRLPSNSVLVTAFNKHIKDEMAAKYTAAGMSYVTCSTIHALGLSALRSLGKFKIDDGKYPAIIDDYLKANGLEKVFDAENEDFVDLKSRIGKLVGMAQLTLTDPSSEEALKEMANEYNLDMDFWDITWKAVKPVIETGISQARFVVSFNDMVYLPYAMRMQPAKYQYVLVDEAQDLNRAQLELVMNARAYGGIMIFCGDKRQAIYKFAGADHRSVDNIIARTGAATLPLSYCYRCPITHIELAAAVWPGILPAPQAQKGEIRHVRESDLEKPGQIERGDLILCRVTAPLISLCFKLIRAGVGARVRGRDIGQSLFVVLNQIQKRKGFKFADFAYHLDMWRDIQTQIKQRQGADFSAIQTIEDKAETLMAIYEGAEPKPESIEDLMKVIDELFSDEESAVWLSTIHRAKGLEADRVIILRTELMPHPMAKSEADIVQEYNAKYVALTRAKKILILADGEEEEAKPAEAA